MQRPDICVPLSSSHAAWQRWRSDALCAATLKPASELSATGGARNRGANVASSRKAGAQRLGCGCEEAPDGSVWDWQAALRALSSTASLHQPIFFQDLLAA